MLVASSGHLDRWDKMGLSRNWNALRRLERNKDGLSSEVQDNGGVFTWSTCLRTIKTDAKKIEVKFFDQQRNTVGPLHYGGSFETIITLN